MFQAGCISVYKEGKAYGGIKAPWLAQAQNKKGPCHYGWGLLQNHCQDGLIDHPEKFIERLFCITVEHPRIFFKEERVFNARIARTLATLRHENLL